MQSLPLIDQRETTLRGLIPEDLLRFAWLEEVAIAPDGYRVAYTVRRSDVAQNGYLSDVYLVNVATGEARKLTRPGRASSLAWSRDGARLAFVWQGEEHVQVEVHDADGGFLRSYGVEGAPPSDLDWSPDGKRIAASRWTKTWREADWRARPGVPAPTIRVVRRLRYKQDGAGWVHDRFRHIWILDIERDEWAQLTGGECDYGQPRWSWKGDRLAYVATAREQDTPLGQGQILLHDIADGSVTPLIPGWTGAAVSPQWREDDGAMAFAGYRAEPPVNRRLFYHVWLHEQGSGETRDLTAEVDQTVGNYAVADQRAGLTNITVRWPGGRGPISFLLTEQGATHLYSVTAEGEWRRQAGEHSVIFEYSPAENDRVAFGMASPNSIGDLYLMQGEETTRLTDLNPWLGAHRLAEPREYWYEGLDGNRVHAWELPPLDFDPERRYPFIVYVHCSMFSWDFNHELQCMANAGLGVVYFNQRGTTAGYGQAHALGNYYGKQHAEFGEIMRGVDDLLLRPYVDAARLGVTGGSCGGYMTNWIIGHTDRFAAAVTQRSITDLVSKFGTSDNGPEQAISEGASAPWEDVHRLWENSPLAHAEAIHTPLLILHSTEDHRCALSQGEELFARLRWLGRPVEMVIFEGENHGLVRGGSPGNRIERLRRIIGWFTKHL